MKKTRLALMAVIMVAAVAFASGCGKPADADKDDAVIDNVPSASEIVAVTSFRTGTWTSAAGTNYVFYEDGRSGRNVNVADGMGVGFEYELSADGSCVFHMGSADDNTPATVEFIGGGDDTAAITWADGSRMVIMFVSSDTSDEFADSFVMGEITASEE